MALQVSSAPLNQPSLSPGVLSAPQNQPTLAPHVATQPQQPTLAPRVVTQPSQPSLSPVVQSSSQALGTISSGVPPIVNAINSARTERGATGQQILSAIIAQNPKANGVIQIALKRGATPDQILDEIIKQHGYTPQYQNLQSSSDTPQFTGGPLARAIKETAYQVKENTIGALKSIPAALVGFGQLGSDALQAITGVKSNNVPATGPAITPTSQAQKAGFIGGQIAQVLATGTPSTSILSGAEDIANLANLERFGKVGQIAQKGISIAARSATEGVVGYGTARIQGASNESAKTVGKVSAAIPIVGAIIRPLLENGIPKLLALTSPVPEEVLQRNLQRPLEMKQALQIAKQGEGEQVLTKVQQATRGLRQTLTKQYQEGTLWLADHFSGQAMGLNDTEIKTFNKIADEFAIETKVPNLQKMSVKQSLQLYKEINEAGSGLAGQVSPKGALLREFRSAFRDKMVKNFGGEGGFVDQFLTQYSVKKTVHDAADSLVKAYKTNNPKTQATALKTLKNAFKESNGAYLNTLEELQAETGINVMDYVGALQQVKVLAPSSSALGNSVLGKADKLLKALSFPFTSPRLAGFEARTVGKLVNGQGPVRSLIFGTTK